jgi:hypothetical protein
MESSEFFGINILLVGFGALIVVVYLIFLMNKRRKEKFLHPRDRE